MKLYTNTIGPGPRRVTLYLALKGITDIEIVNLKTVLNQHRSAEFLEKAPAGRIPVLHTAEGAYLPESQAIMQYLEERYPTPALRGTTEAERRREDTQAGLITEYYHYAMMMFSHQSPYVSRGLPYAQRRWEQAYEVGLVVRPLWWARLEQVAAVMGASRFLASETPTIPDVMLFAHLEYMRTIYDMFIPPHNRALYAWYQRFSELPGITPLEIDPAHFELYIARYGTRI